MIKIGTILPQFFPTFWRKEMGVFGIDFVDGVAIGFVTRTVGGYSFLSVEEAQSLGLQAMELFGIAQSNLTGTGQANLKIAHPPGYGVAWIEADDNFASIRLLQPDVAKSIRSALGEGFLFTIASRDTCLCWTAEAPDHIQKKHSLEASEDFEADDYNLSPLVFVSSEQFPFREFIPPE